MSRIPSVHPSTKIGYELPTESEVRIIVFDMLGRKVADLVDGQQGAGTHTAMWDARHVPAASMCAGWRRWDRMAQRSSLRRR